MKLFKPLINFIKDPVSLKDNKIYFLIVFMIVFSFIYLFLDDDHFSGVNKYKEIIREEVIKNIAEKKITENFNLKNKNDEEILNKIEILPHGDNLFKRFEREVALDESTEEAKEDVIEKDISLETLKPSIFQQLYNRLYFSINTACLLGYGDVFPLTNLCKLIAMIQAILTIALILA